jgi:hypothetical protein
VRRRAAWGAAEFALYLLTKAAAAREVGASISRLPRNLLGFKPDPWNTGNVEYRFGSVALPACSSDRAPESTKILSENLITRPPLGLREHMHLKGDTQWLPVP